MAEEECQAPIAPHRGFNQKARDVLIGDDDVNIPYLRKMPFKSNSEFDLRKKLRNRKGSNNSSPKSQSSTNSISEQPGFDTIGEESKVIKKHLRLAEIGKARSCAELKSDKRMLRTFQEDNILKMPRLNMHDDEGVCGSSVVPHRGFSQKAREVLIGDDEMNHYENSIRGTPGRTLSDYELRKKMRMKKGSNNSSPKSESSSNSLGEQPVFDTIGEESRVKKHMRLSDIGKTRSCNELKTEKKARKGMQDDNVLKMPSIDSDIGSPTRSDGKPIAFDELCMEFYSMGQKSEYSTDEKNKKKLK